MQMLVFRTYGILLTPVLPSQPKRSLSQLERMLEMLLHTEEGELDVRCSSGDTVEQN